MLSLVAHCRNDRNGGCARSDHHDLLAGVVEVLRPELRVDDLAGKLGKVEACIIGVIVIVIARTKVEPARGHQLALTLACFNGDMPCSVRLAPVCTHHLLLV